MSTTPPTTDLDDFNTCILDEGVSRGYKWRIRYNRFGCRCGYVLVPRLHPWARMEIEEIATLVHGGITYHAEASNRAGVWVGFDCSHWMDWPDPSLPRSADLKDMEAPPMDGTPDLPVHYWTQAEVRAEVEQLITDAIAIMPPWAMAITPAWSWMRAVAAWCRKNIMRV